MPRSLLASVMALAWTASAAMAQERPQPPERIGLPPYATRDLFAAMLCDPAVGCAASQLFFTPTEDGSRFVMQGWANIQTTLSPSESGGIGPMVYSFGLADGSTFIYPSTFWRPPDYLPCTSHCTESIFVTTTMDALPLTLTVYVGMFPPDWTSTNKPPAHTLPQAVLPTLVYSPTVVPEPAPVLLLGGGLAALGGLGVVRRRRSGTA